MPFLGAPNVMVNFAAGELAVRKPFNGPGAVSRTATNCSVSLWSQGAFVQADVDGVVFSVVAVGRWK
mgnify:FL=1